MKLIVTRHGETEENKLGILQGHMPGTLSKEGVQQAKKLALRLKDEKIDLIYSSDLKRAKDTTKEIIKFHKNTPVFYIKELREGDNGSYEGKKRTEVDLNHFPEDAESLENMMKRIGGFLDKLYQENKDKTILFICHGGIKRSLIAHILNKPVSYIKEVPKPENTAVSIFEIREDKNHKMHLLNCIKHLEWN